ncbi:MAG: hypothetical protein M1814_003443 [Vezdaea aestivalis]|nr:MAG: hypothetical protein M1814_003443 [Vezdaea aestivalis]
MATSGPGYQSTGMKRILREHMDLVSNPSTSYTVSPIADDLFQWHFTLHGPPSSPYAGGLYHGRIDLPPNYPFAPPSYRFLTPSGRFEVNRPLCLSISGHHEESWQPAWGLRTAVVALRSFMETEANGQVGGMDFPVEGRERLAGESRAWACRDCKARNDELLPGEPDDDEMAAEKVPEGLKLQYLDQLGKEKAKEAKPAGQANTVQPTPTVPVEPPQPLRINMANLIMPPAATGVDLRNIPPNMTEVERQAYLETHRRFRQRAPSSTAATDGSAAENDQHQEQVPAMVARIQGTRVTPLNAPIPPPPPPPQLQEDPASAWLDNAIIGVGAMLGFMVFKKAFGIEIL